MANASTLVLRGNEFTFSYEQAELRRTVRRWCQQHCTPESVRHTMGTDTGFDRALWKKLGAEVGVIGLDVPVELGGEGGTLVDKAIVVEELGAALVCGPVLGTLALATSLLAAVADQSSTPGLLEALAAGTTTAAVGVPHRGAGIDVAGIAATAHCRDGHWTLSGTAEHVLDAPQADVVLVAARSDAGVALFLADAGAPGYAAQPLSTLDLTRRRANLAFDDCPATLITSETNEVAALTAAYDRATVLLAAEQLGAAQHCFDAAVAHAKTRIQFGRPIGSFQAVKHRLADLMITLEHARSVVYYAAWALKEDGTNPAVLASLAKATATDAFSTTAAQTLQIFGGIGFTWEHHAHLYFKRAVTDAATLGSAAEHRERLAAHLLDQPHT
ncbi:acyl-CoA dehydrogenase family protein [Gordonia liuliyuniae]|uniref:Acyl-CoA/acyl-ACP dehydrogenase n=1 Tax=Gordonia liuliyuniae TaxID=2911517 RepID=A0ABS9IWB3_9ACTN|nr:acyl-CoA dehydrogenase family protein [Gordonia liuliyuniae]MCF8589859.1 acyl-CoA/acyl-ACP dehydrogenase [Gordonia liuliyuniae]